MPAQQHPATEDAISHLSIRRALYASTILALCVFLSACRLQPTTAPRVDCDAKIDPPKMILQK